MSQMPDDLNTVNPPSSWVLSIFPTENQGFLPGIPVVGGKGANLARLAQAGYPVPPGFMITTAAYQAYAAGQDLEVEILAALPEGENPELAALEDASGRIRPLFTPDKIDPEFREALIDSYNRLGSPPVAVRSSATLEDLPELSFAGQQDTFLNVIGVEPLLEAVVNCWSSLWAARAIGYRQRSGIPHRGAALAVVVQEMVPSQAAGVMFTANPLTGLRSETVIDAALGLGEALVSGQVEPDHYTVDLEQQRITSKMLGRKALSIRSQPGGGTAVFREAGENIQALPDQAILDLAKFGAQIGEMYGFPQDIEWAWVDGCLYILQSRPITSLYPTPDGVQAGPLQVYFSVAAVQGMLDPITPLGQDGLRLFFASGSSLFGTPYTIETQKVLFHAGERLWIDITPILRNSVGRRLLQTALVWVEPSVQQILGNLLDDPRLQPSRTGIRRKTLRRLARFFIPIAANILLNLIAPRRRRAHTLANGEQMLEEISRRAAAVSGDRYQRLGQLAALLPEIGRDSLPRMLILFVSGVASGMASFQLLNRLCGGLPPQGDAWEDRVLEVTRGLPFNPTTQMDLDLWEIAQTIRQDPLARQVFQEFNPHALAEKYQKNDLPTTLQSAAARFLDRYGGRGLAEIDLGRPRWREDPAHIFEALSGYLQIEPGPRDPAAVFTRGAQTAQEAVDLLAAGLRKTRLGWLKAPLARFLARRVRALMGMRESPKFFIVRFFAQYRWALFAVGEEFVEAGELEQPDDLFFLSFAELRAFAAREGDGWRGRIHQRRENYTREMRRRQIPRLLLSDGRAYYEGIAAPAGSGSALAGSPVSPGSVEGCVRVVLDPRQASLKPGEILVCRGTDPSWTPLFLTAGGLVMEVGGMMTHGAVVAREYGIPAVVGVDQAVTRLHTGQRIQVNGSNGVITVLETEQESGCVLRGNRLPG